MPADNVVPINPQARIPDPTRTGDRTPRRFRWFVAGLSVVWAGALTAALLFTPFPALWQLLVLAALVVAAEHRFVLFGDETSMSASIVVILCAVTFWRSDAYLVGPMLVASCGGLLFALIRQRAVTKVIANSTGMSLAAGAAAMAVHGVHNISETRYSLAAALAFGCIAYWVVNNAVVARYIRDTAGDSYFQLLWDLIRSDFEVVVFALTASAIVGYSSFSSASTVLTIALLAISSATWQVSHHDRLTAHGSTVNRIRIAVPSFSIAALCFLEVGVIRNADWPALAVMAVLIVWMAAPGSMINRFAYHPQFTLLCVFLVVLASPTACVFSAIAAGALLWSRRITPARRKELAALTSIATALSLSTISQSPSIIACVSWSLGVCLLATVGSRLLEVLPSARRIHRPIFFGIAIPGHDDALLIFLAIPMTLTLNKFTGLSIAFAAAIAAVSLALQGAPSRSEIKTRQSVGNAHSKDA